MTSYYDDFLYTESVTFYHGQTVRLPCNTSQRNYVQWNYRRHSDVHNVGVYENGRIDETYKRFSVEYPLIIKNATAEDEGYYTCVEDEGRGHESIRYHLTYEGTVLWCARSLEDN